MPSFDPHLWRLAGRLADRVAKLHPQTNLNRLDHAAWMSARRLESRLDELASRNWQTARTHVRWQLQSSLRWLQSSLGNLLKDLPPVCRLTEPPNPRQVYEELLATRDEFDDFEFDLRQQTLSVTTDSITLEETLLGRFRIVLDFANLSANVCYRVVAETPHPAASQLDATHPHVMNERLCEGDGGAALEEALRTGRMCDFFQIINLTLQTYNASSAYASLNEWEEGAECRACGDRLSEDDSYCCDDCGATTCENCCTCCQHCGVSACDSCIQSCPNCGEKSCSACLDPHRAECTAVAQPA